METTSHSQRDFELQVFGMTRQDVLDRASEYVARGCSGRMMQMSMLSDAQELMCHADPRSLEKARQILNRVKLLIDLGGGR